MTDTTVTTGKLPWWFWLVCAIGFVWNGFGALDFAMSAIQGDSWYRVAGMSDAMIAHMNTYPAWMWAVWFAGAWGGFIGTLLLILRRKLALPFFVISLVGFLLSLVYAYFINPAPAGEPSMVVMQIVIFVGCVFFIWFARFATGKGWLR